MGRGRRRAVRRSAWLGPLAVSRPASGAGRAAGRRRRWWPRPAQTRSHSASRSASGASSRSASRSVKKHGPSARRARTPAPASSSGPASPRRGGAGCRSAGLGGGLGVPTQRDVLAEVQRDAPIGTRTRPPRRSAPAPIQTSSPLAQSSSIQAASRRPTRRGSTSRSQVLRRSARAPATARAARAGARRRRRLRRPHGGRSRARPAGRPRRRAARRARSPCAAPPARRAAGGAGPRRRTTRGGRRWARAPAAGGAAPAGTSEAGSGAARRGPALRCARARAAPAPGRPPRARSARRLRGRETARGWRRSGAAARTQRVGDVGEERLGQAAGRDDAERVAVEAGVGGVDEALLAADAHADGAPLALAAPSSRPSGVDALEDAFGDLGGIQVAERRSASCSSSRVAARVCSRAALQVVLQRAQRAGVDQLAQLLLAEQLAQQVAVERQRGGAALGVRGVALVHVGGDVVEQQRAGERRGRRRSRPRRG